MLNADIYTKTRLNLNLTIYFLNASPTPHTVLFERHSIIYLYKYNLISLIVIINNIDILLYFC